ncbi:MAG: nodulation protein NodH, partial [Pararhodobacter sp.]
EDQRLAFKAYLKFCRASVYGQTGLQPWPVWATQAALLDGYARVIRPDLVLREADMGEDLPALARRLGHKAPMAPHSDAPPLGMMDAEITELSRAAYGRDYDTFGFSDL